MDLSGQDVPAAIPSAILAFDLAFGALGMKELRVSAVSSNQNVLSLNKKFGFRQVAVETGAQVIGGKPVDLIRFVLMAAELAEAARAVTADGPAGGRHRCWTGSGPNRGGNRIWNANNKKNIYGFEPLSNY